ncbi:arsenosugar biosynthesis radical SAM (seleno)protein ArsS [Thioalkalivibrio paradoxus]|uniref:Fe-S oxidoreductase n=1 Tax=Thioalkalivibrio paradoxus ARh 1 TaxID=713585 RepID=W0DLZ7_9GAMM|nr:arsenosugar biosynthesis radical SAM (seleno)protein ArsS [Thioalkalivibrio paradoxus]AHE97910.1 Fe-S oxidoreductase [Thioalkalivibrio paradoxus ARh 1]
MANREPVLALGDFPAIKRSAVTTLQVNLGYVCNQTCFHCHVNAGPNRKESMAHETVENVLAFLGRSGVHTLDLTGGAPELNPHFRELVSRARALGVEVIDRCNLTVLGQPGQQDLAAFLASHRVAVIASLPCYLEENVNAQRGDGVFDGSLSGLRALNALGYGQPGSGLELNLVFNPQGPQLPPPQAALEADYRAHLGNRYGIVFNRLLTIANMPINRFAKTLARKGEYNRYLQLLRQAHQDANLEQVMCRSLVSVDWQGFAYDCDFNQMLHIPLAAGGRPRSHIRDLDPAALAGRNIAVADHCYGCTAGQGSSCGGALA